MSKNHHNRAIEFTLQRNVFGLNVKLSAANKRGTTGKKQHIFIYYHKDFHLKPVNSQQYNNTVSAGVESLKKTDEVSIST